MAITGNYPVPLLRFYMELAQIGMYCGNDDAALLCQFPGFLQTYFRSVNTGYVVSTRCQINGVSPLSFRQRQNLSFRDSVNHRYKKIIWCRAVSKARFAVTFIPVHDFVLSTVFFACL